MHEFRSTFMGEQKLMNQLPKVENSFIGIIVLYILVAEKAEASSASYALAFQDRSRLF
jgi:hypothetical protein